MMKLNGRILFECDFNHNSNQFDSDCKHYHEVSMVYTDYAICGKFILDLIPDKNLFMDKYWSGLNMSSQVCGVDKKHLFRQLVD
jgi:hypothetical protein